MAKDGPLSSRRSVAMTTAEAATFLGLSVQSVTRRAQAGLIPVHHVFGRYHFFVDELVNWLRTFPMHHGAVGGPNRAPDAGTPRSGPA